LHESIKASIDRCDEAHNRLQATLDEFSNDMKNLQQSLIGRSTDDTADQANEEREDEQSPMPQDYLSLEGNATQMASLLQDLVKHYDLCVTALRHTEGGGEAIAALPEAQDSGFGADVTAPNNEGQMPDEMSETERHDVLMILANDAGEVDDVVSDIRDNLASMEEGLVAVTIYIDRLRSRSATLQQSLHLLAEVATHVPAFVAAAEDFLVLWDEEKSELSSRVEELHGMREIYESFLSAYDGLMIEVARRRNVQKQMEKVAKEAMGRIEQLHEDEVEERAAFRSELAQFLPSDIWPGLDDSPVKYEVKAVEGAEAVSIPRVSKERLSQALKRRKAGR